MSELEKELTLLPPPELVQYVGGDFKKLEKSFCSILFKLALYNQMKKY